MDKELLNILGEKLQVKLTGMKEVQGGDINRTYIVSGDGKKYFLKCNDAQRPDMFEKEFRGLELLRNAQAIYVPQPLHQGKWNDTTYLVMEVIEKGNADKTFWLDFARRLSALHSNTTQLFGLDHDNYIGSIPQSNKQSASWSEFYSEQRILFLVKSAFDQQKCDRNDTKLADRLCGRLEDLFPVEPPALLHGDLWSGNYMIGWDGQPVIYDPAVYYGHREMDLGMTLLFGGFDNSFYSHYNESSPLEKSWRERVPLTQLYPLLVHLLLFGGHYYHSVKDVLKKYS
jgi:fructosamine-3-kinase